MFGSDESSLNDFGIRRGGKEFAVKDGEAFGAEVGFRGEFRDFKFIIAAQNNVLAEFAEELKIAAFGGAVGGFLSNHGFAVSGERDDHIFQVAGDERVGEFVGGDQLVLNHADEACERIRIAGGYQAVEWQLPAIHHRFQHVWVNVYPVIGISVLSAVDTVVALPEIDTVHNAVANRRGFDFQSGEDQRGGAEAQDQAGSVWISGTVDGEIRAVSGMYSHQMGLYYFFFFHDFNCFV